MPLRLPFTSLQLPVASPKWDELFGDENPPAASPAAATNTIATPALTIATPALTNIANQYYPNPHRYELAPAPHFSVPPRTGERNGYYTYKNLKPWGPFTYDTLGQLHPDITFDKKSLKHYLYRKYPLPFPP